MPDVTEIHSLCNQKGGVGKTTITMNLAAVVYEVLTSDVAGDFTGPCPVLVVNADPQSSAVWWANRGEQMGSLPFDYVNMDDPADLAKLRGSQYRHVFVDTPGYLESGERGQAVLDEVDDVVVPMTPNPLSFEPTARTIADVIEPRGIPFRVVINDFDPRDGKTDLIQTAQYVAGMGWPLCRIPVRHYKLHARASAAGMVCTQYPKNRVALEAKGDFLQLALELGYGGQKS
jgi:chromosome partitioning protein